MKRPYVKVSTDWCDEVLKEWALQLRTRPRDAVLVTGSYTPTGSIMKTFPASAKELSARGKETRPAGKSHSPTGHLVPGLTGVAYLADRVMLRIAGVDARCAWAIRAEYGLLPEVPLGVDTKAKANHLGMYLDGRVWPAAAYADRLSRGLQMFAVGYLVQSKP